MHDSNDSPAPIGHLFSQTVTEGSARFWAAHFTQGHGGAAVRAALCFVHQMDQLTTVSAEVIGEKSVWWHEELTDATAATARHPATKALLAEIARLPALDDAQGTREAAVVDTMHHHLHGALMSQQRTALDSADAWEQFAELRFGSLHELLALAGGLTPKQAAKLRRWTARLHAFGVARAPDCYTDARFLPPPESALEAGPGSLHELQDVLGSQPRTAAANRVLIRHELNWWKRHPVTASPVFTGVPVGLRGMLASWLAARKPTAD